MNSQSLPPIDPELRDQLTRRSAGRLPEGLLAGVSTAIDSGPAPRADARWPRATWRSPRLAMAGMGMALVAILAVAIALPAFHTGPAAAFPGYPSERALTTAELASLLAGPELAPNTTVVASVTIDSRRDACPMNSRMTFGVVRGIDPQVCVVGAIGSSLDGPTGPGIFAFRVLARGVVMLTESAPSDLLGLLGEITPASSSRLAFRVTDDWPLAGKAFLVEGWLGATSLSCVKPEEVGVDPLDPYADDPCFQHWLSADSSPNQIRGWEVPTGPVVPSFDLLGLQAQARPVQAAGMRRVDAIDTAAPVHGIYVVRSVGGPCPGDSPVSSRGCAQWRVLATVPADLTAAPATPSPAGSPTEAPPQTPVPEPTPSPTASAETPHVGYPTDRALTAAELAAVMAGPALAANTTLVARVTINGKTYCPTDPYAAIGVVEGMRSQVCVEGVSLTFPKVTDTFAFRYLRPGVLENLGQIEPASSSRLLFRATDGWPWGFAEYHTFLVGGYLVREPTGSRIVDTLSGPAPASGYTFQTVAVDAAAGIDSIDPSQYGVFVVVAVWVSVPASTMGPQGDGIAFHVVAKVADVSVPGAKASPTKPPQASPSGAPATASPTARPAAAPLGILGPGGRALTANELATIWATDPDHLTGHIAIAAGPLPGGFICWSAGAADASASPGTCHVGILENISAGSGTWAVQIGADGSLLVLGEIATKGSGSVSLLTEALADRASDKLYVVWAYALAEPDPACASGCNNPNESVWLSSDGVKHDLVVRTGSYVKFLGLPPDGTYPTRLGVFLVGLHQDNGEIVAVLMSSGSN